MKKLQLYRIEMEQNNNDTSRRKYKESNKNSDYYSMYSENVDIIILDRKINNHIDSNLSNIPLIQPNSNLNEYHDMIKLKKYEEIPKENRINTVDTNIILNDKYLTIQLSTVEKLLKRDS